MERAPGISSSAVGRTLPPSTPGNFILRSRLFPLFQSQTPGATLVVAPAGYGKTSLVAEWAAQDSRPTFWYSVDSEDAISDLPKFLISSVRQKFPKFAEENEDVNSSNPLTAIRALNFEVAQLNQPINFVIDNGRIDNSGIAPFAQAIIDLLANNIHLVLIRRVTPETSLARYASVGNLSLITSQDLKFNKDEISKIALLNGIEPLNPEFEKSIAICDGWPAAVQMLSRNISAGVSSTSFSPSATNPLGILALETYNVLLEENKSKLLRLSLMQEFDLESAKIVLGEDFSEAYIHKLATDGAFVTASSGVSRNYKFNQIVFETLSQINDAGSERYISIHEKLCEHFLSKGETSKALHHGLLSGNQKRFNEVLRSGIREMAQTGRGDELIRWSEYAGIGSEYGATRKLIVKALGHIVNMNFELAEAVATEARFSLGENNADPDQISRIDLILAYVYFSRGDLERARNTQERSLKDADPMNKARFQDRISLYRLGAAIAFIHDDYQSITKIYDEARELLVDSTWGNAAYQIQCIRTLKLFGEGNLFEAAESAAIVLTKAQEIGYSGVFAPLDVMIAMARCELEFSHLEKAYDLYERVAELAHSWKIWPWYFLATGSKYRIDVVRGSFDSTISGIEFQRKFLNQFNYPNQLDWMIDMSEAFLRYVIEDYDRVDQLIERMPSIDMIKQLRFNAEVRKKPDKIQVVLNRLPESTPREKIFKFMSEAFAFSSKENVALNSLRQALELGSEVGFHETFVRQNKLYPLFVKVALEKPSYFLENLVREMTGRIQLMNTDTGSPNEKLTARELEILKHLPTGAPISSIAKQLHISQNTMKTHLRNTYRKLGADGRHSAVVIAQKLLLI